LFVPAIGAREGAAMERSRSRARLRLPVSGPVKRAAEFGYLFAGCLIIAISFNVFYFSNQLASGGVSGISIIVNHLTGIEPALIQWGLNIPLLIAGYLLLGRQFGMRTLVGSTLLPLLILLTKGIPPMTENILLASIYGGILVGAGLGIVFRGRGSTGGLDLAAQLLHKYTGISLGLAIALLDGTVILSAGFVFSAEKALFALIGLFVTSKAIDIVQLGLAQSKVAFVISKEPDRMREAILYELDRGLTKLSGAGGYTGEERTVLMVVVSQKEVLRLKELVKHIDPSAFVILSDTNEVLGEGFKLHGTA
jgi:uncharacterized membrane-anchored protein YitT (DUF2179 family)